MALDKELGQTIADEIQRKRIAAIEKAGGTYAKIAKELCVIAFSRIDDYMTISEGGEVTALSFDEIRKKKKGPAKLAALKKVREKRRIITTPGTKDKPDSDVILDATVEYELYDKLDALKYLIKLRGDEPANKQEVEGELTVNVINFGAEEECK